MGTRRSVTFDGVVVAVFGDGTLPDILLSCLQFRIVADMAVRGRAIPVHLLQLRRHLAHGCPGCSRHVAGRLAEPLGGAVRRSDPYAGS